MKPLQWIFLSETGKTNKVTLFHSLQTGIFAVFLDHSLLTIQTEIFDTYQYTFFIDDVLCELHFHKNNQDISYSFRRNTEINTPFNIQKRITERNNLIKASIFSAILLFLALLSGFGLQSFMNKKSQASRQIQLTHKGITTPAIIFFDTINFRAYYEFIAGNRVHSFSLADKAYSRASGLQLIDSSYFLPIQNGDEFLVRYLPDSPEINRLLLNQPTDFQHLQFATRVAIAYMSYHPNLTVDQAICHLKQAIQLLGTDALPLFYYQQGKPDTYFPKNRFNRDVFDSFVTNQPFLQSIQASCE